MKVLKYILFGLGALMLITSCEKEGEAGEKGTDGKGYENIRQNGSFVTTISGLRGDSTSFSEEVKFEYDKKYESEFSVVGVDSFEFEIERQLDQYEENYMEVNFTINGLGGANEITNLDFYIQFALYYAPVYDVILNGDDIYDEMTISNVVFDQTTGKLSFDYAGTVPYGDWANDAKSDLTITGSFNGTVYQDGN